MKKIIFTGIVFTIALAANAQSSKPFTLSTGIGTGIDMTTPARTPFAWQLAGHYHWNTRFSTGVGTGISLYEKVLIPLFAAIKFNLTSPRKFTPFIECQAGYGFAPDKKTNGGLYIYPAVGLQYALRSHKHLFAAIGYEMQQLERVKSYQNTFFTSEYKEKLNHKLIGIRIGFIF